MQFIVDSVGFLVQGIGYLIAGFVALVILAMIFGEKINWKFEAEGFCEAFARSKVKVKIRELATKGQTLELKGKLTEKYQRKEIDVLLNEREIATIEKHQNDGSRYSVTQSIDIAKPKKGDVLSIKIGNEEVYSERLV